MKIINKLYAALILLLLLAPAVTMPLFRNEVNTENRELSSFPVLIEEGKLNPNFSDQLNTWIQEHIGFRSRFVSANSALKAALGQSAEKSIIVGTDGWLYYADTVKDYLNVPTLSARNVKNIAHSLKLFQDFAREQGADFTVALVPNKNTLYGGNMPSGYTPLKNEGNLELVQNAMKAESVTYADLKAEFEALDRILYQKADSHWTYEGALLGFDTIMDRLGKQDRARELFAGLKFSARKDWSPDLAVALYGTGAESGEQLYPEYTFTYEITSHEKAVNAILLTTAQPSGSGTAVIYRDSFLNTMQVYAAECFEKAVFSRAVPYQGSLITGSQADTVILELVERNIPNLAASAPILPAPEVELKGTAVTVDGSAVTHFEEKAGSYQHLYGTIAKELLGDSYRVYLYVQHESGDRTFEAFPIFEQSLLKADECGDNGWSLYIRPELLPPGVRLNLIIETDDMRYIAPIE